MGRLSRACGKYRLSTASGRVPESEKRKVWCRWAVAASLDERAGLAPSRAGDCLEVEVRLRSGARQHHTGRGSASTSTALAVGNTSGHGWRAGRRIGWQLSLAPSTDPDHGALALGADRGLFRGRERFGRFEIGPRRLPSGTFGPAQQSRLAQEGAHPVELDAPGRM